MEVRGRGVGKTATPSPSPSAKAPEKTDKTKTLPHARLQKRDGVRATIAPKPVRPATVSSAAKATAIATCAALNVAPRQSTLEFSLVDNLKRQIAFLEAQIVCLKRQEETRESEKATTRAATASAAAASRHMDPVAIAPEDRAAGGFANVPEPYQTEMVALQLNLERVLADYDTVQSQNRHVEEEKCTMAAEIAELRTELRAANQKTAVVEAERDALREALHTEQAGRRLLEEQLSQAGSADGPSSHTKTPELLDVLHQKDYFKVQVDRLKVQEGVLVAKAGALEAAVTGEQATNKALEAELCRALDRVSELEACGERLRVFYAKLGGRYITTAAMLRKVLEMAKQRAGDDKSTAAVYGEVEAKAGGRTAVDAALARAEAFQRDVREHLPEAAANTPSDATMPSGEGQEEKLLAKPSEEKPAVAPPPASVPSPPPPPPAVSVPAPPQPPPPPTTEVPAPPATGSTVAVAAVSESAAGPTGPQTALQRELAALEAKIANEEASLAAYVAANGADSG